MFGCPKLWLKNPARRAGGDQVKRSTGSVLPRRERGNELCIDSQCHTNVRATESPARGPQRRALSPSSCSCRWLREHQCPRWKRCRRPSEGGFVSLGTDSSDVLLASLSRHSHRRAKGWPEHSTVLPVKRPRTGTSGAGQCSPASTQVAAVRRSVRSGRFGSVAAAPFVTSEAPLPSERA